jgi:hypothetical protein
VGEGLFYSEWKTHTTYVMNEVKGMKEITSFYFIFIIIILMTVSSCYIINQEPAVVCFDMGTLVKGESRAPALNAVDGIRLNITGPGMDQIEKYYPPQVKVVSCDVPAGKDRVITIALEIDPFNPSAVLAFGDRVVTNLKPGEIKVLTMGMKPVKTKIVVPDNNAGFTPARVIQYNDISGSNPQYLYGTDIAGWDESVFMPYDIALDRMGRIYIANNYASTGYGCVVRVDTISGENPFPYTDTMFALVAVAIDMERNLLYYASANNLWRSPLDNSISPTQLSITGITEIQGIEIDENGFLYIVSSPGAAAQGVYYYDPFTENIDPVRQYTSGILNGPRDALVKNNIVYVSNKFGQPNELILQFDRNLNLIQGYGNVAAGISGSQGEFYGPCTFVAILNKKITVIDDTNNEMDKIVSMDDIYGRNWQSFPPDGDGSGFFIFYEC